MEAKEKALNLLNESKKVFDGMDTIAKNTTMLKVNEKLVTMFELQKELSDKIEYWNNVYKELIEL